MLRGPHLYPTVASHWADDIEFVNPTRQNYLDTLRRLQDRATRRHLAMGAGHHPDDSTPWRSRPLTRADRRARPRFNEITAEDVTDYVNHRDDGQPRADRSRAHVLGIVWQLYNWATDPSAGELCGTTPGPLVASNPAARLRAQGRRNRRSPRDVNRKTWLTADWVRVLIAATRGDGTEAVDRRDVVLIALYLYTGLRLSELIRVRWRDVDFSAGEHGGINVIRKGGKPGLALLNAAARRELFAWRSAFVAAVGEDISDLGIIPQTRAITIGSPTARPRRWRVEIVWTRRITAGCSVREIVAARAEAAGISHLRPHDLRRSYAGILEDAGADLRDIQAGLGHAQMATTERYLKQRTKLAPAARGIDFG